MIRLFESETENMRDIGGCKIGENKEIRYNRFIRSNVPVNLSVGSIEKLINNNVITIIDLRTSEEVRQKNGVFFNNEDFEYYNIEIAGGGRIPEKTEKVMDSYIEMLEGKEEIRKVFGIISECNGGIVYYCNAGKDRTGVLTAIILKLLGASDEDVIEDYILSGVFLDKKLKEFAKMSEIDNVLEIITPKRETMINLLNYIKTNYGGAEGYLKEIGVTEDDIERIKNQNIKVVSE